MANQALRLPVLGAFTWTPCLFAQRGGGHAAPWSNCWHRSTQMSGSGWQTPAWEGSSLCLIWRLCTRWARLLSLWWEAQLNNRSASARVPGLVGTSTYSYDPDPEHMSVLCPVLPSRPGIWGPEWHQHGPPLWRRRTDAAVTEDRLSAGTPKGTLPLGPTCLQEAEDHTAQEAGAHGGAGAGRGPSGLSVDERARGSPGSPSEMSLSMPGPRDNLSHGGHAPSPRGSNQSD